jgi:hypothetical protein
MRTKATPAGLPLGAWALAERLSHRGRLSVLQGKLKAPKLSFQYRSSGGCRLSALTVVRITGIAWAWTGFTTSFTGQVRNE